MDEQEWTFDSTVVTMDSEQYTMDGAFLGEPPFTTKVYLTQRLQVVNGARIVIAKED